MPTLELTKTYQDGQTPSADDIDGLRTPLEIFLNSTKINSDNIQTSAVTTALLDSEAVTTNAFEDLSVTRAKLATANYQLSSSSGTFAANTALSLTDITNLSVTITTVGRPVLITLVSGDTSNEATIGISGALSSAFSSLILLRGSTTVASCSLTATESSGPGVGTFYPPGIFKHIDVVAAGTYTYKMQVQIGANDAPFACSYVKLLAYEIV